MMENHENLQDGLNQKKEILKIMWHCNTHRRQTYNFARNDMKNTTHTKIQKIYLKFKNSP